MSTLPKKHHERLELCLSRAKYREGREPKAVKVYTISQESQYLLVQGVPALGTEKDLQKLFSEYGTLLQSSVLHEYPAEEFTEVYLFKYQRIQSARIAKKKTDNISFFGGVLHVCYAPEYETVDETRQKLQDRRRVIAKRCRQLAAEKPQNPVKPSNETQTSTDTEHNVSDPSASSSYSDETRFHQQSNLAVAGTSRVPEHSNPVSSQPPDGHNAPHIPMVLPPPLHTVPWTMLPPPPPPVDCARVPSSHATLPPSLQHELNSKFRENIQKPLRKKTANDARVNQRRYMATSAVKSTEKIQNSSQGESSHQGIPGSLPKFKNNTEELIIRPHKPSSVKPKFVPRQVVKKSTVLPGQKLAKAVRSDSVNSKLRSEAMELRNPQGPQLPEEQERKRKTFTDSETGSESLDSTVVGIREKVKQFSTQQPDLKHKKQKTQDASSSPDFPDSLNHQ